VADTKIPGTALIPTGRVTHCCGLHAAGDWFACCDTDCLPCCDECPTCPGLIRAEGLNHEWRWLAPMFAAHAIATGDLNYG
jgi:hypothetical protein